MTDRVTRIYEGALQLLVHRNGPNSPNLLLDVNANKEEIINCVLFAAALDKVVQAATKEES